MGYTFKGEHITVERDDKGLTVTTKSGAEIDITDVSYLNIQALCAAYAAAEKKAAKINAEVELLLAEANELLIQTRKIITMEELEGNLSAKEAGVCHAIVTGEKKVPEAAFQALEALQADKKSRNKSKAIVVGAKPAKQAKQAPAEKPKRIRRTKEQIAADEAAGIVKGRKKPAVEKEASVAGVADKPVRKLPVKEKVLQKKPVKKPAKSAADATVAPKRKGRPPRLVSVEPTETPVTSAE